MGGLDQLAGLAHVEKAMPDERATIIRAMMKTLTSSIVAVNTTKACLGAERLLVRPWGGAVSGAIVRRYSACQGCVCLPDGGRRPLGRGCISKESR
ncbi:hypothetical protein PRJ_1004 [Pseudomonas sp. XWY-1]|nr:hypothetical protein PRJ_1004 [Pseudomonas sp. XWY-1]